MKRLIQLLMLSLFLANTIFPQRSDVHNTFTVLLNESQSAANFKDIKVLLSKAEALFDSQEKKFLKTPDELAVLKLNFALFRISIKEVLSKKLYTPGNSDDELRIFHKIYPSNNQEISKLLTATIKIYEQNPIVEDINLAIAKFELAKFFEKQVPKSKNYSGLEGQVKRLKEIQDLYLRSLILQEKLVNKNNDLFLATTNQLAKNFSQMGDFENALIYYEKSVSAISEKYGQKSEKLLTLLVSIAVIWKTLDQKDSFEKTKERISEITNENLNFDEMHLQLTVRARSFKYKGIQGESAKMVGRGPLGIRQGGTDYESADFNSANSIRSRPETKQPNFATIIPGDSKLKFTDIIKTFIEVDENGKVVSTKAETDVPELKEKAEREVMKWEFNPLVFHGKKMTMKGFVYYFNL